MEWFSELTQEVKNEFNNIFKKPRTAASTTMNVITRGYDNNRSMCNPTETILTPTAIATKGIRKIFDLPFEGDARGMEAQPLLVNNLTFPDGRVHNVMFSATMTNQIWAHDADNSQLLWETTLNNSIVGTKDIDMYLINDHWGILSTPVIDVESLTLYCVTWGCTDALAADGIFLIHAVNLLTGEQTQTPLSLEGASYTAAGKTTIFKSVMRKQRSSLLMTNINGVKTVFIAAGSMMESASTNQGWLIAVDVASWKISAAWASTVTGSGGGIWMAGGGPAADSNGFIYLVTGNGDFDAVTNFGESIVKLQYTGTALTVVDWFAPWTDNQRNGSGTDEKDVEEEKPRPSNYRALHSRAVKGLPINQGMSMNAWGDMDLGSGGVSLWEDLGIVAVAGKDSVLYCANMNNLGKTTLAQAGTAANYAKLAMPPIFFGYYQPGNPMPPNISALNLLYGGVTHHQHGEIIYWNRPTLGDLVFNWSENGNLRAWSVTKNSIKYLACSAEMASPDCVGTPGGGMPGGMISLASNGETNGIIIACVPYGNANTEVTPGRLLIYDAQTFVKFADGSNQMKVLWDSAAWNITFSHNKFNRPVVSGGLIYCPTYNGQTDVYQLA
jgi:hypothetical protein